MRRQERKLKHRRVATRLVEIGKPKLWLSQALSERAGESIQANRVNQWIRGVCDPPREFAVLIAELLELPFDTIWSDEPESTPALELSRIRESVDLLRNSIADIPHLAGRPPVAGTAALVPAVIDVEDGPDLDISMLTSYDEIDKVEVPVALVGGDPALFAVRVGGAHLEPCFHENDLLLVSPASKPQDGSYIYFQRQAQPPFLAIFYGTTPHPTVNPVGTPSRPSFTLQQPADGSILGKIIMVMREL